MFVLLKNWMNVTCIFYVRSHYKTRFYDEKLFF